MSDKPNIKIGDWVSFMKAGFIVIGEVRYIRKDDHSQTLWLYTHAGMVFDGSVLEVRHAAK